MNFKSKKRSVLCIATAAAAFAANPGIVYAQDQDDGAEETDDDRMIVVTGSLIRGVEVTGSQTIDIGETEILENGASTTNELLADVPQIANFFNQRFDQDPRAPDRLQVARPNLRNLPGINAATGATTLILVDGHRMVPMGVDQASFDPDFLAPGALQRVEIVTDGGTSLYGADAVGGVINFITRDDYDGVKLDGGYEFGDSYDAYSLGITAGANFGDASAFFSYSYYDRDVLLNGDRDFAVQGDFSSTEEIPTPTGTQCPQPVGEETRFFFFGAGFTDNPQAPGAGMFPIGTPCDDFAEETLLPGLKRHSALAGFQADLSDNVSFEVKAHFGDASTRYAKFPLGATISEPPPVPNGNESTGDIVSTFAVGFSFEPNAAYVDRDQLIDLRSYGIAPEFVFNLGGSGDWQMRNTLYWGRSENSRVLPAVDQARLEEAVAAGTVAPTNIAAADAGTITSILNSELAGETEQDLLLLRTIVDGGLFEFGDDMVRAAVGVEYNRDYAKSRSDQVDIGGLSAIPFRTASRNVYSVFGELSVPLFSIASLSLSGRYDDYSDFGDTFNPNVGLSITPFDGLRIYGHWSESFNAPTALDAVRTANARFIPGAARVVPDPNMERTDMTRDDVLLIEGSGGGLQPQEAETWSVGAEFEPVSNLVFNVNYYDIEFTNLLGAVNPQLTSVVLLNPDKFIFEPSQAVFDQFLATSTNGVAQFGGIDAGDVAVIVDRRVSNLGAASLQGVDFSVDYFTDIGFGELSLGVSGNHQINFDITENANTVDQLEFDLSDTSFSAYLGLDSGGFSSRVTVNHSTGFNTNTALNQTEVDGFTLVNLYLGYEFPEGSGVAEGLAFRLNIDNVFDQDPPFFRLPQRPAYAFFTPGRIFKISVSKEF